MSEESHTAAEARRRTQSLDQEVNINYEVRTREVIPQQR